MVFGNALGEGLVDAASRPAYEPAMHAAEPWPAGGDSEYVQQYGAANNRTALNAANRAADADYYSAVPSDPTAVHDDWRRAEHAGQGGSVAGASRRARAGEGISDMVGTSNPQAVGNFMRANGMTGDQLAAGRNYFVPDDRMAYGSQEAEGQRALNAGNKRIADAKAAELAKIFRQGGLTGFDGPSFDDGLVAPAPRFGGYAVPSARALEAALDAAGNERRSQIAAAALGGEFSVLAAELSPEIASGYAGPAGDLVRDPIGAGYGLLKSGYKNTVGWALSSAIKGGSYLEAGDLMWSHAVLGTDPWEDVTQTMRLGNQAADLVMPKARTPGQEVGMAIGDAGFAAYGTTALVRGGTALYADWRIASQPERLGLLDEMAVDHIGAASGHGEFSRINPSNRLDNCTACTTAVILNKTERLGAESLNADAVERLFGYTGRERSFNWQRSLSYIEENTGLKGTQAAFMEAEAQAGHYAVFPRVAGEPYQHVMYGQVLPNGQRYLYDAQVGAKMTWEEMTRIYTGGAKTFILE
jgi:hypothetical protein